METKENQRFFDYEAYKDKPVCMLYCWELVELIRYANSNLTGETGSNTKKTAVGMKELADELSCSQSVLYKMKKENILDNAVISRIGRRFVYDVEKARELANLWRNNKK